MNKEKNIRVFNGRKRKRKKEILGFSMEDRERVRKKY
jgi:hypothetical protein